MSTLALLLAAALLCWPSSSARHRLRRLTGTGSPVRLPHPGGPLVVLLAAVLAIPVLGPGGAVAVALATATGWRRWCARHRMRTKIAAVGGLAEAIGSMVAELRAGAHPADAAHAAAGDAEPTAAAVLGTVAAAARLGGDVERALVRGHVAPESMQAAGQLGRAWTLVQRHGLPLADVLGAVRRDLDQRARFAKQVQARMAGPRASAAVLAVLPLLGILLGQSMGARPLHVLVSTGAGQFLLVLGVLFGCTGVAWSARLTDRAVLP